MDRPLQIAQNEQCLCPPGIVTKRHQRVISAEEDFINQVDRMTCHVNIRWLSFFVTWAHEQNISLERMGVRHGLIPQATAESSICQQRRPSHPERVMLCREISQLPEGGLVML